MFKKLLSIALVLLGCCSLSFAQNPWSGIVDTSRALNWSNAGYQGSTSRNTICFTESANTATASSINSDIQACPAGQVVFLQAGNYTLSGGLIMKSNVTLRGAGANATVLQFSSDTLCDGQGADICVMGENTYYGSSWILPGGSQAANVTNGSLPAGTTAIILGSIGATAPILGQYIYIDQNDVSADNGNFFVCDNQTAPCSLEGGAPGRTVNSLHSNQVQVVKVTNINTGTHTYTISPGLYGNNWSTSLNPGAWWAATPMTGVGIENLTLDHTSSSELFGIEIFNAFDSWVSGVTSINANRNHVLLSQAAHITVQNSYFYGTKNAGVTSYGIESSLSSDNLVVNNIFQKVDAPIILGTAMGSVFAYNYTVNDYDNSTNWLQQANAMGHDAGASYNLFEGNSGTGFWGDVFHGTSGLETMFRNQATGWEPGKTEVTIPVQLESYNREDNVIGNVLGQSSSFNTSYQTQLGPGGGAAIYDLGAGNTEASVTVPNDSSVASTLMRWGNYDTYNGAVRWLSSEVPSGLSVYANAVPASQALPPSFWLSSQPSWWPSGKAWPAIGPDVATGNVGMCSSLSTYSGSRATASSQCPSGTLSTAWASHVNSIPAMDCYLNTMGGPADGSGNSLAFNASTCYTSQQTATPVLPTSTTTPPYTFPVNSLIAITDATPGSVIYYTTDGTTPAPPPNQVGTLYSAPFALSSVGTTTVKAIAVAQGTPPSSIAMVPYSIPAQTNTVLTNIEDTNALGWSICSTNGVCNPGGDETPSSVLAFFGNTAQQLDGTSVELQLGTNIKTAGHYSNALWTYKGPGCDGCTSFSADFQVYYDASITNVGNFEYDMFQFAPSNTTYFNSGNTVGEQAMFGAQWERAGNGDWYVWQPNSTTVPGSGAWVDSGVNLSLSTGWHHFQFAYHRDADPSTSCAIGATNLPCMHYDSITVDGTLHTLPSTYSGHAVAAQPIGPLTSGWASQTGIQFQLDNNATGAVVTEEYLDKASFAATSSPLSLGITATNGSVSGPNCSPNNYSSGTTIGPCTATPNSGYTFSGWSGTGSASSISGTGQSQSFAITANSTMTASFTAISSSGFTVTAANGSLSGTNCSTNSAVTNGTSITCSETANSGYAFYGWTGTGSASNSLSSSETFVIRQASTLTANYVSTAPTDRAYISSPAFGNQLFGQNVVFVWSASSSILSSIKDVTVQITDPTGALVGSYAYMTTPVNSSTGFTLYDLPTNSENLLVTVTTNFASSQLIWQAVYQASDRPLPVITSPLSGTQMPSGNMTWTWSAAPSAAAHVYFHVWDANGNLLANQDMGTGSTDPRTKTIWSGSWPHTGNLTADIEAAPSYSYNYPPMPVITNPAPLQ